MTDDQLNELEATLKSGGCLIYDEVIDLVAELRREREKVKVAREALDAIRDDYVGNGHLAGSALKEMDTLGKIREDG